MPNYINSLPDEISIYIYRIYFNNNILDKINNLKCFRNFLS